MEENITLTVRFNECDMYGHVNHAVYLNYLEHGRLEMFRSRGISLTELATRGYRLIVVNVNVSYRIAALYGDNLQIVTTVKKMRHTGGIFTQKILRGDSIIVEAEISWACIDDANKPVKIPSDLKEKMPSLE